ncbi:MAG: ABC transporter permease [Clostridium sp.]
MSNTSLIFAGVLTLIPICISYKERLYLGKDICISIIRAVIQLLIVGGLLEVIFGLKSPIYIFTIVLIMILNAAINTKGKSGKIDNSVEISFIAICIGSFVTIGVLITTKAIKFEATEVIPIAGMIISNTMVAISLGYRSLNNEFQNKRYEIETRLSLGCNMKEASKEILRESIKIAVMPTIESAKTLGIISLPGMMTGLILGGVSPILAVKYQIMVTFMVLSSSFIGILIAVYLGYKNFFTKRVQLK